MLASRLIEALLKYIHTEDNDLLNTVDESWTHVKDRVECRNYRVKHKKKKKKKWRVYLFLRLKIRKKLKMCEGFLIFN